MGEYLGQFRLYEGTDGVLEVDVLAHEEEIPGIITFRNGTNAEPQPKEHWIPHHATVYLRGDELIQDPPVEIYRHGKPFGTDTVLFGIPHKVTDNGFDPTEMDQALNVAAEMGWDLSEVADLIP